MGYRDSPVIFEEKLIYFPSHDFDVEPGSIGLRHEPVTLVTDDETRLDAWFLPADSVPRRHTVLVCHGNAGNMSHRLDRVSRWQRNLGVDVFLFDYRGFGRSEGRPTEEGTYQDGLAAYRYLTEERGVEPGRLVLFGESLGAAVAIELARRRAASALVLEAPFTSIADMAKLVYPFIPTRWVRTRYDNLSKVSGLSLPLLVVHGTDDPTVPLACGERLFAAAAEPKSFLSVEGAGHTDAYIVGSERYWDAWRALLASVSSGG